ADRLNSRPPAVGPWGAPSPTPSGGNNGGGAPGRVKGQSRRRIDRIVVAFVGKNEARLRRRRKCRGIEPGRYGKCRRAAIGHQLAPWNFQEFTAIAVGHCSLRWINWDRPRLAWRILALFDTQRQVSSSLAHLGSPLHP